MWLSNISCINDIIIQYVNELLQKDKYDKLLMELIHTIKVIKTANTLKYIQQPTLDFFGLLCKLLVFNNN